MRTKTLHAVSVLHRKAAHMAEKATPVMTGACTFYSILAGFQAHAAGAIDFVELIIQILAVLIIVGGVFNGIVGLSSFAEAKAEGDGPAQNKAKGQLIAAGMLLVLSILLLANAGRIAGMIQTTI